MSFLAGARAALAGVLGDPGPLLPAVIGIVVYAFFYPLPYLPQVVRELPLAVVDADASPLSRELARELDATPELHVSGTVRTMEEALPLLHDGRVGGIFAIPPDFERDVMRGSGTGVTVMANGGLIVLDGTILGTAAKVTAASVAAEAGASLARAGVPGAVLGRAARAPPLLVKQPLFNWVAGYESYVVSASMGLLVMQLLVVAIAMVTGTWSETGQWPAAPGGKLTVAAFAGTVAGFALIVWAAAAFWIGFVFWYHDLPRAANLGGALAFGALYACTIACVGVGIGAWMAERERILQIVGASSFVLLFMSGFAFPVESFSAPVRMASLAFPSTPGIQGFIALNQMGAHWSEVAPQLVHLAALFALYAAFAWLMATRRTGR